MMMKRLFVLLLTLLLFSGCASRTPLQEPYPELAPDPPVILQTVPEELYDPDSILEAETAGALKVYPLSHCTPLRFYVMGQDLILLAEKDGGSILQKLSGEKLSVTRTASFCTALSPEEGYLRLSRRHIICCDKEAGEVVVLDPELQEIQRIPIPDDIVGLPLLCADGSALYYCTSNAVRVLETDTNISRVLKELPECRIQADGLHFSDSLLQCTLYREDGRMESLFLSTENGRLLWEQEGRIHLDTSGNRYYGRVSTDSGEYLVFGGKGEAPMALNPAESGSLCRFFPEEHRAVTFRSGADELELALYDLSSGKLLSRLTLAGMTLLFPPESTGDGFVWFLGQQSLREYPALYRWDITATATECSAVYTDAHYTATSPDREGLARCRQYAADISEKYGIEILTDPTDFFDTPENYTLEYEHLVPRLWACLERLDFQLGSYPEGFLQTLSGHFSGVRIALVRSIAEEDGTALSGLQFWEGNAACIVLTADSRSTALYRELCRLCDSVVITKSSAYDRWDKLNPSGFSYLYQKPEALSVMHQTFLKEGSQCFVDKYAMISPAEDRSRIMEQAMSEEGESCFRSLAMQSKLLQLCIGIREAFGLKKSSEVFLWEQYLNTSLAWSP